MAWTWDGYKVCLVRISGKWAADVSSGLRVKKAKKAVQSRELVGCDLTQPFKRLEMKLDYLCNRDLIKFTTPWIIIVLNMLFFEEGGFWHWVHWSNPHLCVVYVVCPLIPLQSIRTLVGFGMPTSIVACLVRGSTWVNDSAWNYLKLFLQSVAQPASSSSSLYVPVRSNTWEILKNRFQNSAFHS